MISIIIPTKNEAHKIEPLLQSIVALEGQKEIIVVDGGSEDATVSIAERYGHVIVTQAGRGHQLREGALAAKGDIFWFVHADGKVDSNALTTIEKVLSDQRDKPQSRQVGGGCFSLYFHDVDTRRMRALAWSSNLRAKHLNLMFGDQGIFVTRWAYETCGGFKPMPLMEDWEFSKRLSKFTRVVVLPERIGTSGRRFVQGGFFKTLLQMHRIKLMYVLGFPIENIAKSYKAIR